MLLSSNMGMRTFCFGPGMTNEYEHCLLSLCFVPLLAIQGAHVDNANSPSAEL